MTRNIPLKLWAAPLLLVLACNPGSESAPLEAAPIAPTDPVAALPCIDEDGDGRGFNCDLGSDCNDADAETWQDCAACATPSLGCPCPNDAASVECASAPSISSTGNVLCEVGTRYCRDGAWTACEGLENFELPASALTLYSRARIDPSERHDRCSICRPDCFRVNDFLDPTSDPDANSGSGGSSNVTMAGSALSLTPDSESVATATDAACDPINDSDCDGVPNDYDTDPDASQFESPHPAIFMDLPADSSQTTRVGTEFKLRTADVYFMLDQSGSMWEEQQRLLSDLTQGTFLSDTEIDCADRDGDREPDNDLKAGGVAGNLACVIRDVWMGAGWFREIPFGPLCNAHTDQQMFEHVLDMSQDVELVQEAIQRFEVDSNMSVPEAPMQALHALATGDELYAGWDRPGVPARENCGEERWGYPCFREGAVPIVMLFTDAPMFNGPTPEGAEHLGWNWCFEPGDNIPLDYPAEMLRMNAGTDGTYAVIEENESFDTAYLIDGPVEGSLRTFAGTTRGFAGETMSSDVPTSELSCMNDTQGGGADAVYKFQVEERSQVTLSTVGTRFQPTLALFQPQGDGTIVLPGDETNEVAPDGTGYGSVDNALALPSLGEALTTITGDTEDLTLGDEDGTLRPEEVGTELEVGEGAWQSTEISPPAGLTGSTVRVDDTYTLRGSGNDIWGSRDNFHYNHMELTGDFTIKARLEKFHRYDTENNNGECRNWWAKSGLHARSTLSPGSPEVSVFGNSGQHYRFMQWRARQNNGSSWSYHRGSSPMYIKLERSGTSYRGYHSEDGEIWTEIRSVGLNLGDTIHVGLAVSSHNKNEICQAVFSDVSVSQGDETVDTTPGAWTSEDVHDMPIAGSNSHNGGDLVIEGAGNNIWYSNDSFRYTYQEIEGDTLITARVRSLKRTSGAAMAGVMIREDLSPGSPQAMTMQTPDWRRAFRFRGERDKGSNWFYTGGRPPGWIRLWRKDDTFISYISDDGVRWTEVGGKTIPMDEKVYVGLAVASMDNSVLTEAVFTDINIIDLDPQEEPELAPMEAIDTSPDKWRSQDVYPFRGYPGSAEPLGDGTFAVRGSGNDIAGGADDFEFVYQEIEGDVTLTAQVNSLDYTDPWAKSGLMVRASLDAQSANVHMLQTAGRYRGLTYRQHTAWGTGTIWAYGNYAPENGKGWVRLSRRGDSFIGYLSEDGNNWVEVGTIAVPMDEKVYVGMAVTSRNPHKTAEAIFSHVQVQKVDTDIPEVEAVEDLVAMDTSLDAMQQADIFPFMGHPGSAQQVGDKIVVRGSGHDIWNRRDGFHYLYQEMQGNATITAHVEDITYTNCWAKSGVMIRDGLWSGDKHVSVFQTPHCGRGFQYRDQTNNYSRHVGSSGNGAGWVRLKRQGDKFTGYVSNDGLSWSKISETSVSMNQTVYVGLAVTSHNYTKIADATFSTIQLASNDVPQDTSFARFTSKDIFNVGKPGTAYEIEGSGDSEVGLAIEGSGHNIWGREDGMHYVYREITGDATILTKVDQFTGGQSWAKMGLMIRDGVEANDRNVMVFQNSNRYQGLQWRSTTGGHSYWLTQYTQYTPTWLRLDKRAQYFNASVSNDDGATWNPLGPIMVNMEDTVQVGFAVTATDNQRIAHAELQNLQILVPPEGAASPIEDYTDVDIGWDNWNTADIKYRPLPGSEEIVDGRYTVHGSGHYIGGYTDGFRFVYQELEGDAVITARVESLTRTEYWAQAGATIRDTLAEDSPHSLMFLNGSGYHHSMYYRGGKRHYTRGMHTRGVQPGWMRVERKGDRLYGYRSEDGETWEELGIQNIPFEDTIYVGLAVSARNVRKLADAVFTDVEIKTRSKAIEEEILVQTMQRHQFPRETLGCFDTELETEGADRADIAAFTFRLKQDTALQASARFLDSSKNVALALFASTPLSPVDVPVVVPDDTESPNEKDLGSLDGEHLRVVGGYTGHVDVAADHGELFADMDCDLTGASPDNVYHFSLDQDRLVLAQTAGPGDKLSAVYTGPGVYCDGDEDTNDDSICDGLSVETIDFRHSNAGVSCQRNDDAPITAGAPSVQLNSDLPSTLGALGLKAKDPDGLERPFLFHPDKGLGVVGSNAGSIERIDQGEKAELRILDDEILGAKVSVRVDNIQRKAASDEDAAWIQLTAMHETRVVATRTFSPEWSKVTSAWTLLSGVEDRIDWNPNAVFDRILVESINDSAFTLRDLQITAVPTSAARTDFDHVIGIARRGVDGGLEAVSCGKSDAGRARVDSELTSGDYAVIIRGRKPSDVGKYTLTIRDEEAAPEPIACHNTAALRDGDRLLVEELPAKDENGNTITYHMVMRGHEESDEGEYALELRTGETTVSPGDLLSCDSTGDAEITRVLEAGSYFAVVKGRSAEEKGWYQFTVGDTTREVTDNFDAKHWLGPDRDGVGGVAEVLRENGVRVLPISSTDWLSNFGALQDQAEQLATGTGAMSMTGQPLTYTIESDGSGLSSTVINAVQELAGSLTMDVTLDLQGNPGFQFGARAMDEGECDNSGGEVHWQCKPGSKPKFEVTFRNESNVPKNEDDPNGGYNMMLNVIGDERYLVERIPLYVIPDQIGEGEDSGVRFPSTGQYTQNLDSNGCTGNDRPDWNDIYWNATVPQGTSVRFEVCAATTAGGLSSCDYNPVATVTGGSACDQDDDCEGGFCVGRMCQFVTGVSCSEDNDCGEAGSCSAGACRYDVRREGLPSAELAPGLSLGENGREHLSMRIVMNASASRRTSPTVFDWGLHYFCAPGL